MIWGELYAQISKIDQAITEDVKVELYVNDARIPHIVDPYYVIAKDGQYRLLCHGDTGGLEAYKLDCIRSVRLRQEKRIALEEVVGEMFEIERYLERNPDLCSGEEKNVEIRLAVENLECVEAYFGKQYTVTYNNGRECILSLDANVNSVYYWVLRNIAKVEVLRPMELRQKILIVLEELVQKYR